MLAHLAGYSVTFSTATFAGQASKCATVTSSSQTGKCCVTDAGYLAYVGVSGATFQLTSFTTAVSASDFALPSGATVETIP